MQVAAPRCEPYRVVRWLGSGATADVFEVEHPTLGSRHALKVLAVQHPSLVARVRREARLQSAVLHPNVLPVLDVLDVEGAPGLLLPLIEGPTLQALLATHTLALDDAVALFRAIACGVAALHEAGLVHRDLKPANVLLDATTGVVVPRIADFGLAKGASDHEAPLTRPGDAVGTPAYAAPEQLVDGRTVGPPADVWALGRILHELVGGRRGALPSPLVLPERWMALRDTLLDPDPVRRPATGAQVVARIGPVPPASGALLAAVRGSRHASPRPEAPSRLPPESGVFVGRVSELGAVRTNLEPPGGPVTLHGGPGSGKTRLARRAAGQADRFGVHRYWVSLAGATSRDAVLGSIAAALELPPGSADIGRALAGRGDVLVVLDDVEGAFDHAVPLIAAWIEAAPLLRVLVASRRRLGTPGERIVAVGALAAGDGARLFVDRASAARPGWQPSEAEVGSISVLVQRLDGNPLAILLAAARVRMMSVNDLHARLDDRFRLLVGEGRSVEGAIEASWDPLDGDERSALAQLSVFVGPFTLEDARAVVDVGAEGPSSVALVGRLVDRGLVDRERERFVLGSAIALFARLRLARPGAFPGSGPAAEQAAWLRHGRWFARLGSREVLDGLRGPAARDLDRRLAAAVPELDVAHTRAVQLGVLDVEVSTALATAAEGTLRAATAGAAARLERLVGRAGERELEVREALGSACHAAGRTADAEQWLRDAFGDAHGEDRVRVGGALAQVIRETGRPSEAAALLEQVLVGADPYPWLVARLTGMWGVSLHDLGRVEEGAALLRRAHGIVSAHGLVTLEGRLLGNLANLAQRAGRLAEAEELQRSALRIARELGDRRSEGVQLSNLGMVLRQSGRRAEATATLLEAARLRRSLGDLRGESQVATALANLALSDGRVVDALEHLVAAQQLARDGGYRPQLGVATVGRGEVELELGRLDSARQQLRDGLLRVREVGDRWNEVHARLGLGKLAFVLGDEREALGELDAALGLAREVSLPRGQAWALLTLGDVHHSSGREHDASRCWGEARDLFRSTGEEEAALAADAALARSRSDPEALQRILEARPDLPSVQGAVGIALAEVALTHGRLDEAAAALDRAMFAFRERTLDLAEAWCLAARLADLRRDRAGAERWANEARLVADRCGLPAGAPLRRRITALGPPVTAG